MKVPFKRDQQVLFIMSDSTGFNAGGTSDVYTVLPSKGGACNAAEPGTDFVFQLNSNLQQCRPFTFSGYDGAIPPVTIGVIIPGGNALTMSPPPGESSYTWSVNAARGTSMIFFMTDSHGRQGGSSDLRSVGASDDNTCLDSSSLSTTTNAPSPTQTNTVAGPSSSGASPSPTSTPISAEGIAGAIIGSVLFLGIVITLGLFMLKRMYGTKPKTQPLSRVDLTDGESGRQIYPNGAPSYGYPSLHPPKSRFDSSSYASNMSASDYGGGKYPASDYGGSKYPASEVSFADTMPQFSPPVLYPPQPLRSYTPQSQQHVSVTAPVSPSSQGDTELPYANPGPPSPQQSSAPDSWHVPTTKQKPALKAQLASRYILHTDADDVAPNEDGMIELPPQYSERQGPGGYNSSAGPTYDSKHPL